VTLEVYNAIGQLVATLVDEEKDPGIYRIGWDGSDNSNLKLPAGVYICRLQTGISVESKRMVFLR
jgi:flagellar hook assembly protein FlgD